MPSASSGRCQVGPGASRTPPTSLTSLRAGNRYAPDPLPCLLPLKSIPFLCCDTVGRRRPNSGRWASHPSPPSITRMPTCASAALSRHVSCGVSWCPVTAAHLRLLSSSLHRLDSGADRSATKSLSRPLRWPSFHYRRRAVETIV
jgi:hypothetical protein